MKLVSCLRYCKSTIFQANHNPSVTTILSQTLFAILQKYDFSSKSQLIPGYSGFSKVVCDTAKVRFFKQITTRRLEVNPIVCCLRYCKSTIFQANHNHLNNKGQHYAVVCDTAKVRFFKQITTSNLPPRT